MTNPECLLTHDFAQSICEILFEETGHPVLMTDNQGIVIASTDKRRIGAIHAVAKQLMEGEMPEKVISEEEAEETEGVKPGIIIPIVYRGIRLVVLEISGEPKIVRPFVGIAARMTHLWLQNKELLTDLKQANQAILDNIKDGYYEADLEGNITAINDSFCESLGYTKNELIGTNYRQHTDRSNAEKLFRIFKQVYKTGISNRGFDCDYIHKDGSERSFECSVSLIVGTGNRKIGFRGIVRDVTERKLVEQEIKATKEKLESLINNTSDAIGIVDLEYKIMRLNRSFEKIFGWEEKELIGRNLPIIPDFLKEETYNLYESVLRGQQVSGFETIRQRKDGSLINVSLTLSPIRNANGKVVGLAGILRDITERKRTEELLRKSDKLAVAGQLAAGIAHEIRNPLTALKGFIQLLQSDTEQPKRQYFEIMLSELERINFIVGEFLMLAKPQAVNFQRKDLCSLLRTIIALLHTQAIIKNIRILDEFASDIPLINCEENQLKQVFINILKNAMEAMPDGGDIAIQVKMLEPAKVLIRIIDQGIGIPENLIPRLGEPFYTTKEKGTGLGLMVSYKIIEDHRGSIRIRSEVNKGTTVDIILPVGDDA